MRVKLFANLAETAGDREVEVDLPANATVRDALDALFAAHPDLEPAVMDEDGRPADHINLLRNGGAIPSGAEGLEEPLAPSDELAIFPPVTGGDR